MQLKHPAAAAGSLPRPRRPRALVAGLVAIALLSAGCSRLPGGVAARLTAGDLLVETDGDWIPVAPGTGLDEGARVRTGDGEARLEFRDGEIRLAPASAATLHPDRAELDSGEALLRTAGGLQLWNSDVLVEGDTVARLVLGAAARVGVYEGAAEVRRTGEGREVPRWRQVSLGSRRLPSTADPLDYSPDDAWDRELLPQAIAFDAEAARLARGLDQEYGDGLRPDTFYASFVAVPAAAVPLLATTARDVADRRFGPPSDALLALFVAQAAAQETGGTVDEFLTEVAGLRDLGARWGIVALEVGITAADLAAAVDLAQARRIAVAAEEASGSGPAAPPSPDSDAAPPPVAPPPQPPDDPASPPEPTPTPSPSEPGIVERTVDGVLDGVQEAADPLLRLLP